MLHGIFEGKHFALGTGEGFVQRLEGVFHLLHLFGGGVLHYPLVFLDVLDGFLGFGDGTFEGTCLDLGDDVLGIGLCAGVFKVAYCFEVLFRLLVRHACFLRTVKDALPVFLLFGEGGFGEGVQLTELRGHGFHLHAVGQFLQAVVACLYLCVHITPFLAERFEGALVLGKPFHGLLDVGCSGCLQSCGERVGGLLLHAAVRQVLNLLQLVDGFGICSRALLRIVTDAFPILLLFGKGVGGKVLQVGELRSHRLVLGSIGQLLQAVVARFNQGVDVFPLLAERFESALVLGKPFHGLLDVGSSGGLQSGGERVGGLLLHAVGLNLLHLLQVGHGFLVERVGFGQAILDFRPVLLLLGKGIDRQVLHLLELVGHDFQFGGIGKGVADFLGFGNLCGKVGPLFLVLGVELHLLGNLDGIVDFAYGITLWLSQYLLGLLGGHLGFHAVYLLQVFEGFTECLAALLGSVVHGLPVFLQLITGIDGEFGHVLHLCFHRTLLACCLFALHGFQLLLVLTPCVAVFGDACKQ